MDKKGGGDGFKERGQSAGAINEAGQRRAGNKGGGGDSTGSGGKESYA